MRTYAFIVIKNAIFFSTANDKNLDTKHEQAFEFRSMIIRKRDDLVHLLNNYLDVSYKTN